MPKVSIIMPAYNAAKYIGPAIESVLGQTLTDWELVVVDDGSTDTTPVLLDKYIDNRIIKIRQANGGEARARNTGLNHAQGDYLAFLDADDLYMPDTLTERVKFFDKHPEYGVVVADGHFCNESCELLGRVSAIRSRDYAGYILEPLVLSPSVVSVPVGIMARRALVEQFNLRFDPEVGYGTDWDFWIRLARYTQFGYLNKLTYLYRVHDTNMTRNTGWQKVLKNWSRGRLKILNSDWFEELAISTRQQFFYDLLVNLLANQPSEQQIVFEHQRFQNLPGLAQAQIWRQVGAEYLMTGSNFDFGVNCLRQAVNLWPGDWKSRSMLAGLRFGQLPVRTLLYGWRWLYKTSNQLRSLGQRRPRAVPAQLRPL